MIKVILWDVDGTLLDFLAAEKAAVRRCFEIFGIGECTDAMIARYSEINKKYWKRLERGELTKAQALRGRFAEFFSGEGIAFNDIDALNAEYQLRLGDTIVFNPGAYELVSFLQGRVRQYAVTNGTSAAQNRKLSRSGLDKLFDGIFISDNVGFEKPRREFFDCVFAETGGCGRDEIMIVGDSLTSDMLGGNNAGVVCCWYNPDGKKAPEGIKIDYDVRSIAEIAGIVG